MSNNEVFIVSGCRTPIGTLEGCLSNLSASNLGSIVIKEALKRGNVDPKTVDEVIMGQVLTGGQGQNPARQSAVAAEIPFDVPACTVNMLCGSGLKVAYLGYQSIKNGDSHIIVCGGQESMSRAVHLAYLRKTTKLGQIDLKDSILLDGLTDAFVNMHMGSTVENLADKYQVSRKEQDEFALLSQMKCKEAVNNGYFKNEIVPVSIPKKTTPITADEYPKPNTTFEGLSSLKPIFKTNGGTVTAGNASGINDGAAVVILSSKSAIEKYNLKPLARIVGFSQSGIEPIDMGIGPVKAVTKLLEKISWTINDVDLFEINEAFAVQSVLIIQMLGLDKTKVNITGGAIALGHPIGASGTRILVTLLNNLERTKKRRGIASLCIGGGMGIAIAVEMCS